MGSHERRAPAPLARRDPCEHRRAVNEDEIEAGDDCGAGDAASERKEAAAPRVASQGVWPPRYCGLPRAGLFEAKGQIKGGSRMDICVQHPAVRSGVETPLGEGSQMTIVYGFPAYETLHTIFKSDSTVPMRLRTSEGERVYGGGRDAFPGPARWRAEPGRRTHRPGAGGLPADRRRRPRPGAPARGGGPGRGPRPWPSSGPCRTNTWLGWTVSPSRWPARGPRSCSRASRSTSTPSTSSCRGGSALDDRLGAVEEAFGKVDQRLERRHILPSPALPSR